MSEVQRRCDPAVVRIEVEDFKTWYNRFRDVVSDLSLVRRVSSIVYDLLNNGCSRDEVVKIIEGVLRDVGVDPSSIRYGEFQGLRGDVVEVLRQVFPYAVQETRAPFFTPQVGERKGESAEWGIDARGPARRLMRHRRPMLSRLRVLWALSAVSLAVSIIGSVLGYRILLSLGLSAFIILIITILLKYINMI